MIVGRAPLRLSLGGGATDLPSYYREHGGFLVAAAIDKYVFISAHDNFNPGFIIKYSETERVEKVAEIRHPLFRESMKLVGGEGWSPLEISAVADVPAGTGLGSSGTFTCALLAVLHGVKRNIVSQQQIAIEACDIELDILQEPVGKQDQYIASFGGLTAFTFHRDGSVAVEPVRCSPTVIDELESNLLLFFTGYSRNASQVLGDQDSRSKSGDAAIIENLHFTKEIGVQSLRALQAGDLHEFAQLMNVHWNRKRQRSAGMSNDRIDDWIKAGLDAGARGGKLVGAGGGGFLMFYAEHKADLRAAMARLGLRELRFRFDNRGVQLINV